MEVHVVPAALGGVFAQLADSWQVAGHVLASPSGLMMLAAVAWLSVRATRASGTPSNPSQPNGSMMAALTRLLPYGTVLIAALVPLAAGRYLMTTTARTLLERVTLRRRLLPAPEPSPHLAPPVPR
jgi:YidC/Oxa1 family membrane protein insertase